MRLSASYLERAIIVWIQYLGIGMIILLPIVYFTSEVKILDVASELLAGGIITLLLMGIIDTLVLVLKFKTIQKLKAADALYLGNRMIIPEDLESITPITYNLGKFNFKVLEFCFKDGMKVFCLCKPQSILAEINDKPTRTLILLKKKFPELKEKIKSKKNI